MHGMRPEGRVVRLRHVRKPYLAPTDRSSQGAREVQIEMIRDHNDVAGCQPIPDSPRRIRDDERSRADRVRDAEGRHHHLVRMPLVHMVATRLHEYGAPLETARHETAGMPLHRRIRQPGDVPERDLDGVFDRVGHPTQPRPQHEEDLGRFGDQLPELRAGCVNLRIVHRTLGRRHTIIPATVAVRKAASEPPIMARSPSFDRSERRSGAMPPIPPIWIAIELKLAKPDSAYVAMISERG